MAKRRISNAYAAAMAAGLLAWSCAKKKSEPSAETVDPNAEVRCEGVNACKGQSACHTRDSACAGMNGCKGQGWIAMTRKNCVAKGGKVGVGPTKM